MALTLPAKNAPPTASNAHQLQERLTSVIFCHPGSTQPWTFYEELDTYLGPWGATGYPLGYGKFYCIAFNGNEKLQHNEMTRDWVKRTTIQLQQALLDFVMQRFRGGLLGTLKEPELRRAAFDAHPRAYDQGGLAMVVLIAPEMLPIIASIPRAQFDPRSADFGPTVEQVFSTMRIILTEMVGNSLAAMAGPAHTGLFSRAMARDRLNFQVELQTTRWLNQTLAAVRTGQMDHIPLLNKLTSRLDATEFPDRELAGQAREVVNAANARKRMVAAVYRRLLSTNPALRESFDQNSPGWDQW